MRVFISHGTDKSSAQELAFLDALYASLNTAVDNGPCIEVLLDRQRLEAGDDWAGMLHDWLAECHGAVLLLSPRALTRPWVLKEATILAFRKAVDPAFELLPVMLPGVDSKAIAQQPGFSALSLPDIQAAGKDDDAATIAATLRSRLARLHPQTPAPLDRLEEVLTAHIQHADAGMVESACEVLLGEPVAWRPDAERRRQCARVLARAIVRGRLGKRLPGPQPATAPQPEPLPALARTLKAAALPRENILHVINLAAPSWVDDEVALRLRSQMQAPPEARRICAINTSMSRYGPLMAVWRMLSPHTPSNVYWIADASADDWAEVIEQRICEVVRKQDPDRYGSDDEVAIELEQRTEPLFFVVPKPLPDADLREALHRRFPCAVFIANTGPTLPAELPDHVLALAPGLPKDQEVPGFAAWRSAKEHA